jgi:hypothetical protein
MFYTNIRIKNKLCINQYIWMKANIWDHFLKNRVQLDVNEIELEDL